MPHPSWKKPYNENNHADDLPIVDSETGEFTPEVTKKKSVCYDVFAVFEEVLGRYPLNWRVNRTQRQSAENLFHEHGLDAVKNALKFYKQNRDDEYCPNVATPYDLDSKWNKLVAFKKKL